MSAPTKSTPSAPARPIDDRSGETKSSTVDLVISKTQDIRNQTVKLVKQPHFQTVTICAASGAITIAAAGGALGCAGGVFVGGAVGVVPALFTFGLSIPAGAVVGGVVGFHAGAAAGAAAGATVGGAAGHGGWVWRVELHDGVAHVRLVAVTRAQMIQAKAAQARQKALGYAAATGKRAAALTDAVKHSGHEIVELRKDRRTQVTAASAAAGGLVGGTAGGGAGAVAGAGVGAIVGLPAALFTFGMSIPVCATMGGTCGLVGGAAAGGAAGATSGAVAGNVGHKYRREIRETATDLWMRARNGTGKLRKKVDESMTQAGLSMKALVAGGTGGTAQ